MSLVRLFRDHGRLLAFGLAFNFFSSPGQSYFIGIFGGAIRDAFGLSHGDWGLIYSIGTVGGALCLIWVGRLIDRVDLRIFSVAVGLALACACLLMSVSSSILALAVTVFALRLSGQGLCMHTAATTVARYTDKRRGLAVGIIAVGVTGAVAVFPRIGVELLDALGWRSSWGAMAIFYAVTLPALSLWLLRGHGERHRAFLAAEEAKMSDGDGVQSQSVAALLRDPSFYMIVPIFVSPTIIFTGFVFHQVHLVEVKGWTAEWFSSWFAAYAVASLCCSLAIGPVIDRIGARQVIPFIMIPFAGAMILISAADDPWSVPFIMIGFGTSVGAFYSVFGAYWAEAYGVAHLGAIRSVTHAVTILSSASSPVAFGWLIDATLTMEMIAVFCLIYLVSASCLAWFGCVKYVRRSISMAGRSVPIDRGEF